MYHEALTFDKIGIPDIDKIFTDLSSTINPFVTNREKMQKARESFEDVCKMICEFDAEKEFKAYLKDLKEKAKKDQIHIYFDVNQGSLEIKSISGVPVPGPYRNAVRLLSDVQSCLEILLDMGPMIQTDIESSLEDVLNISPEKDLRKALTMRELPKLPAKSCIAVTDWLAEMYLKLELTVLHKQFNLLRDPQNNHVPNA